MSHQFFKKPLIPFLMMGFVMSLLFYTLVLQKAMVTIDLKTDAKTTLKIYWRVENQPYSEKNMTRATLDPGIERYRLSICNIGNVTRLRIDTSDQRVANVTLLRVSIKQSGYAPIVFDDQASFAKLVALNGIKSITNSGDGLAIVPSTTDPQLEYQLPNLIYSPEYIANTVKILGIFSVVGLCFLLARAWGRNDQQS